MHTQCVITLCSIARNAEKGCTSIPSLALAMKWLREVHKIWFLIYRDFNNQKWDYGVYHNDYGEELNSGDEHYYDSYQEAVEAALLFTLKNLI